MLIKLAFQKLNLSGAHQLGLQVFFITFSFTL